VIKSSLKTRSDLIKEDTHGKIKGHEKRYKKEGDQNIKGKEKGKAGKEKEGGKRPGVKSAS
jgi:hypothetical protein